MEQCNECKRCGTCCCNIPIFKHEEEKIKKYLKSHPELIQQLFRPFNPNGCVFLLPDEDNTWKCAIYNSGVRPTICKVFGTEGLEELSCPFNCFVGNKYTKKEAQRMIIKNEQKSELVGTMNDIMVPFIVSSAKNAIKKQVFQNFEGKNKNIP